MKRAKRLEDIDVTSQEWRVYVDTYAQGVNRFQEWERFGNYCKAHGKIYKDYSAAFKNWLITAKEKLNRDKAWRNRY